MKVHEVKTYSFEELSEEAKQKALKDLRETECQCEPPWATEYRDTWDALEKLFNVSAEYDRGVSVSFRKWYYDQPREFTGARAMAYLWNNYGNDIFKGKFYSTAGTWKDGKYSYKKRYSKCILDFDCPLTGVCYDMDALDGMVNFMRGKMSAWEYKNTSVEDLVCGCFEDLAKAWDNENEYRLSDEGLKELIEANDWEYLEDGRMFA